MSSTTRLLAISTTTCFHISRSYTQMVGAHPRIRVPNAREPSVSPPRRRQLSMAEKGRIQGLLEEGVSCAEIARRLDRSPRYICRPVSLVPSSFGLLKGLGIYFKGRVTSEADMSKNLVQITVFVCVSFRKLHPASRSKVQRDRLSR